MSSVRIVTLLVRAGLDHLAIGGELLLFVGHVGMREIDVLGAKQADAAGAHRHGRLARRPRC